MTSRRQRLAGAQLYLVCGDIGQTAVAAALRGGVDIVQLRMKGASDAAILAAAGWMAPLCARHDALFILNDRPDLVTEAGADGAHVGQDDTPVQQVRALVGTDRLIGLSTHTPGQVDAAAQQGEVDYIGVGPINVTPTKPGRPAVGTALVTYAAEHAAMPFFAIGGIDRHTIGAVVAAGARRVAAVRAIAEAEDPEAAARELRGTLHGSGLAGAIAAPADRHGTAG